MVHESVDPNRPNVSRSIKAFLSLRDQIKTPHVSLHHRLDVDTSGVLLFARTREGDVALDHVFKERHIKKRYIGLCDSVPEKLSGTLEHFLKKQRIDKRDKMIATRSGGQKAITHYAHIKSSDTVSWIEFDLITGRRHQIRVQCALAGFPICGDSLYGTGHNKDGHWLHAKTISFEDPISASTLEIDAPIPAQFLKRFGGDTTPQSKADTILFHKPYGVLSQFTTLHEGEPSLKDYNFPPDMYPVGRLDKDSEGLLVLTQDKTLHASLAHPQAQKEKTYWVQVEGIPKEADLARLRQGIQLSAFLARPCKAQRIDAPDIEKRNPPIRKRDSIPTTWLEITITEGKNRQIRKMTAAIGFPTLRLIRIALGPFRLGKLKTGQFHIISEE